MIKYKIRGSDWLTFALIIVIFNNFFIQPAPESLLQCFFAYRMRYSSLSVTQQVTEAVTPLETCRFWILSGGECLFLAFAEG